MDVLQDIRGLLSVTHERENVKAVDVNSENSLEAEMTGLKAQIKAMRNWFKSRRRSYSG